MSVLIHQPIRRLFALALIIISLFLTQTIAQAAQVTLAWDPNNPTPDGYRVFQRLEGQSYDYSSPVWPGPGDDPTQTTCTLDNLDNSTSYFFVVRAYVGAEESGDSNEINHVTGPAVPTSYTITADAGDNGSISPASATVDAGANQTFTIEADDGYHIEDVLVDGASVGPVSSYTFGNVSAAHTISASFAVDTHTITVSAGANGSISPGTTTVNAGGSQSFTITPQPNYHIADVLVDGASVGPVSSYTFSNVSAAHTISASFALDAAVHTITVSAGANGSISPGTTTVNAGGSQSFTITPQPNYHIADVLVDGASVGPVSSYTFSNVSAAHTISASFAVDAAVHTITVSAGANGSISPATVTVNAGATQTFNISPETGYHIVDVLIDGQSMGAISSYTFENINADHTIAASFDKDDIAEEVNIVIEAEDFDIYAPMEIADDESASSGAYVWTPTGNGNYSRPKPDGGRLEYRFDIPSAGNYIVWGRVMAADTASDSFFVSVDGSEDIAWHTNLGDQVSWTWDVVSIRKWKDPRDPSNPHLYYLEAGTHTVTIKQREDGTKIDKIVITNKLDMTQAELESKYSGNEVTMAIEAEDGDVYTPMAIVDDESASSGAYVWTPTGNGNYSSPSPDGGRVEYRFDIPSAGDYVIWGRVMAADAASDSFFVSVDGSEDIAWHTMLSDQASWTWDVVSIRNWDDVFDASNPHLYYLEAGTHTVTIKQREDGTKIDKIVVTNKLDMTQAELESKYSGNAVPTAYTITTDAGGNGSISPSSATVDGGASQTFTIAANDGYHIEDVLVDSVSVGPVSSYTFSNVSAAHTISASFAIDTHTITVSAGANGSISPGTTTVNAGESLSFTITPQPNYHIADVLVDGVSVGPVSSYTFSNVSAAHTISASFAVDGYPITVSAGANGSISPGTTTVNAGGSQSFTITPQPNYHIADVLVDGASVGPVSSYTFSNVSAAHTISASFAVDTYTITVSAGANGSISPATVTVNGGATQAFNISPETGYHIVDVLIDGQSMGAISSYTFENINADHTIAASFDKDDIAEEVNIVIEAEDFDIYAPMEIADDESASSGAYVWTPTGNGNYSSPSPDGGRVEYRFDIPSAGDYVIWGRVMAADAASDSFFVSVDGSEDIAWHTMLSDQASWTWDVVSIRNWDDVFDASNPHLYHLEAGTHTITIKQREDGTKIDKIVVTNKLDMTQAELESKYSGNAVNIAIEAEDGDVYTPMAIVDDESASSGAYVWTPTGNGNYSSPSPDGGRVEYRFDIPSAGDYVIWGRVMAADAASDSFFVSVDGSEDIAWHTMLSDQASWTWDVVSIRNWDDVFDASNPHLYHLEAGTHTVTIKQREDGAKIDKIVITNKLDMTQAELE